MRAQVRLSLKLDCDVNGISRAPLSDKDWARIDHGLREAFVARGWGDYLHIIDRYNRRRHLVGDSQQSDDEDADGVPRLRVYDDTGEPASVSTLPAVMPPAKRKRKSADMHMQEGSVLGDVTNSRRVRNKR